MKAILSEDDRARIKHAVESAEGITSGEIVPYVVGRSDSYPQAVWKGAVLGAAVFLGLALALSVTYSGWGMGWLFSVWGPTIMAIAGGAIGASITFFAPVKRLLVGSPYMERRVHERATRAFLEEDLTSTRDRTGILVFVSLLERHIEVIGDEGINRKVDEGEWVGIVERIRDGIRSGRLTDGLVSAIEACGELLRSHKVEIRDDDTDELSNRLRIRKS